MPCNQHNVIIGDRYDGAGNDALYTHLYAPTSVGLPDNPRPTATHSHSTLYSEVMARDGGDNIDGFSRWVTLPLSSPLPSLKLSTLQNR